MYMQELSQNSVSNFFNFFGFKMDGQHDKV